MALQNDTSSISPLLAEELATLAEQLRRCTVQVRSRRLGAGSGVIWNSSGLIITNAHVAPTDRATVELSDGRVMDALVTARDPLRDLAALRIETTNLPAAAIGDSEAMRVGELVLAVGNPLGQVGALTTGIIHAIGNSPPTGERLNGFLASGKNRERWVMADVRLAPGNSGGLLANARGQVIGINTMIADGLALAIPSKAVKRFLRSSSAKPYLGITLQPVPISLENERVLGLLILEVQPSSPASNAGLQLGDVLIGVGGQFFSTLNDLASLLWDAEPDEALPLECLRGGERLVCNVVVRGSTSEVKAA